MKDAKGHGSDAHQSGVQEATDRTHEWIKQGNSHYLVPSGDAAGPRRNVANAIARVEPHLTAEAQKNPPFKATLLAGFNTGSARAGNWMHHKSVVGAKNWVKSTTANSWTPPHIK